MTDFQQLCAFPHTGTPAYIQQTCLTSRISGTQAYLLSGVNTEHVQRQRSRVSDSSARLGLGAQAEMLEQLIETMMAKRRNMFEEGATGEAALL